MTQADQDTASAAANGAADSVAPRRVLIVDDEAAVRALVKAALSTRARRYEVVEAANGNEAIAEAMARQPDVVLLDVGLPDRDGYSVCAELKQNASTAEVPVIMLTAMNFTVDRQRAAEAGADDYMPKPFSPRALLELLEARLVGSRAE